MHNGYSESIIQTGAGSATGGGPAAATQWRQPVADLAALAAVTTDPEGAARYVDDQDAVYIFVEPPTPGVSPDVVAAGAGSWIRISGSAASLYKVQATAPTSPADGCLWAKPNDDSLFKYDGSRNKWLAIEPTNMQATYRRLDPSSPGPSAFFLRSVSGDDFITDTASSQSVQFVLPYDVTLTSISTSTSAYYKGAGPSVIAVDNTLNWTIKVYDKTLGSGGAPVALSVTGLSGSDLTKNIDFNAGTAIAVEGTLTNGAGFPNRVVEWPIIYVTFKRRAS